MYETLARPEGSAGRRVILSLPVTTCVFINGVSGCLEMSSFSFAFFPREEKETLKGQQADQVVLNLSQTKLLTFWC